MTPQALKASILQLAIQGKLVPQRPEEGTAEELYQQIQAEKQALIANGTIKREKALEPIKADEIPFDIPETWKWVRMRNLCTICTGKRDANFGSPDGEFLFFTCAKEPLRCKSYSYEGESILLAGNGDISNISLYNGRFEAYQRTYILQSPTPLYLPYLYYHLQYNWVDYNIGKVFGSAIPYIRLGNLENYPVALPPLEEQKRIVAKIEEMLPLIDRYGEAYDELETFNKRFPDDLRKSILQEAIQGKLVPQLPEEGTAEELYQQIQAEKQRLIAAGTIKKEKPLPPIEEKDLPFDIPETWKWVHLDAIAQTNLGKTLDKGKNTGVERPYLCSINVYWEGVNLEKLKTALFEPKELEKYRLEKGDLLICEGGDVGRCAIWENDNEMYYQNALHRVRFFGGINPYFYRYLIEYYKHIGIIDEYSKGQTIKHLVQTKLCSIWMPLPPLAEQKRIVAKIEELLTLCTSMR